MHLPTVQPRVKYYYCLVETGSPACTSDLLKLIHSITINILMPVQMSNSSTLQRSVLQMASPTYKSSQKTNI